MKKIKNSNSNLAFEEYTMEKIPLKQVFKNDIKIMNIFLVFFLLLGLIFYFIFGWGSLIFCLGLWLLITINLFINDISINKKTPKYIEVNIMNIKVILNNRQNFSILFSDIISINRQYYVSKSGVRWSNYYEFITENKTYKLSFSNMTYDEKFKITIREHIKFLNERGLKKQRKRIKNYSEKDRLKLLCDSKKIRVFPEKSIIKVRYKSYKIEELKKIEFYISEDSPAPRFIFHYKTGKKERWRFGANPKTINNLIFTLLLIEREYLIQMEFKFLADITLIEDRKEDKQN